MTRNWHEFTRPLVICLFSNNGRILAAKGTDSIKQNEFYRPLGGMIEFGERSTDALKREIMEETNQEITNLKYVTTVENIFTYEGKAGHEIVMVYDAEFKDKSLYDKDEIDVTEGDIWCKAYWLSINDCKSGKLILYPEGILDHF
jgi:ADP-ribose pyrophosphatase YjhB (NUDIX family)